MHSFLHFERLELHASHACHIQSFTYGYPAVHPDKSHPARNAAGKWTWCFGEMRRNIARRCRLCRSYCPLRLCRIYLRGKANSLLLLEGRAKCCARSPQPESHPCLHAGAGCPAFPDEIVRMVVTRRRYDRDRLVAVSPGARTSRQQWNTLVLINPRIIERA